MDSMTYRFTEAEMGVVKETFSHFDTDGDGFITRKELGTAMRSLEHVLVHLGEVFTDEKLDEMIKAADTDGDGKVSFQEFVRMVTKRSEDPGVNPV